MELPLGYGNQGESTSKSMVCRLHKSIYGLKQASRQWNLKFTEVLLQVGFAQSKADYSLFTRGSDNDFVVVVLYVDDIVIVVPVSKKSAKSSPI